MARRRKQSGAEDLMDLVAMLPWWAGVALAVTSYLVLHKLSVAPKPAALQPGQMAQFVQGAMLASLAFAGQFVVPPLCLVAALVSFLRRKKRGALTGQVTQSESADVLNDMSWREFEMLVGEAFRLRGYKVAEHGGAEAPGALKRSPTAATSRWWTGPSCST